MDERIEIRGEFFVTLETAAAWYRVERRWVEEGYSAGLLGQGERVGGALAVPASELAAWPRRCAGIDITASSSRPWRRSSPTDTRGACALPTQLVGLGPRVGVQPQLRVRVTRERASAR